ncbi:hypothetical protein [Nocardia sp. NPDC005825]|uniref:hypothetical protein n=1 Tax=unclassified Nocardia TaxID=2637762 RepID=UPI0034008291
MSEPIRLIIWGPGEVGGSVLRAARLDPRFEIVGVKVFSPHKDGKDAGELVGIEPIGVVATRSKERILALDADCVIVAPQPMSIFEGLDDDVIALLESGKNVVTTAAYHNVTMPNWYNSARTPMARMRAIANIAGAARSRGERLAMGLLRATDRLSRLDGILDPLVAGAVDAQAAQRATPQRLMAACRAGGSSLHGTGVHPTFMVERHLIRLCRALPEVSHVRFVEALDFAMAPEGMWGGLELFGFGRDPADIGADSLLAKAGDFYYGDLTGNVAHALYGAHPDRVRVERSLRGIPARRDITVGSTRIRAGTTAVMHMTHRGYLDDRHFFTNEECWYLTPDNLFHGDDLPYGGHPEHSGYSYEITAPTATIRGQISGRELPSDGNPITSMSVRAVLDAVEPVCTAAPGILIDDAGAHYRTETGSLL